MSSRSILFIADPWKTLDRPRDSTLHLAAVARADFGARCFWAVPEGIHFTHGRLHARLEGEVSAGAGATASMLVPVSRGGRATDAGAPLAAFHSVHWRADPPVTLSQMRLWSLLACSAGATPIVNSPRSLLEWNEKFSPFRFPRAWSIPSLVSDQLEHCRRYLEEHRGKWARTGLVVKASGEAASRGVSLIRPPVHVEPALRLIRSVRRRYGPWVVLQPFESSIHTRGETRVFVLGGRIAGAIRKLPTAESPIMDLDLPSGRRPALTVCEPSREQRARSRRIARALTGSGAYLATIDFIGSRVLEVNVTSPGLVRWLDQRRSGRDSIARRYWEGLF